MGSKQIRKISILNMAVGGVILVLVALMLFGGLIADNIAIFAFLSGASNLFYGFTVYRALVDTEPEQATFHGLLKRANSSWLVPALMTAAPLITEGRVVAYTFVIGVLSVVVSLLLDYCLRNAAKGR